ncbi:hypothetical protein D3C78_1783550 [compost metagenome]
MAFEFLVPPGIGHQALVDRRKGLVEIDGRLAVEDFIVPLHGEPHRRRDLARMLNQMLAGHMARAPQAYHRRLDALVLR